MKISKLKCAVIGFGYWGPNICRNIRAVNTLELVAIIENDESRRQRAEDTFPGVNLFECLDDAFAVDFDCVMVATPPETHFELGRKSLLAGKHIFVEKPLCMSVIECEALSLLADSGRLSIGVDHTFLFTGAVQKLKNLIMDGEIGNPLYFNSERSNLGLIQEKANVVWDLLPHDLSILMYLTDRRPSHVFVSAARYFNSKVDEIAHVSLMFPGGLFAGINLSWISPVKVRRIVLAGSAKSVIFDDTESIDKLKVYDRGVDVNLSDETAFTPTYRSGGMYSPKLDNVEALKVELEQYAESLLSGAEFRSGYGLGRDVVAVLEACDLSLEKNAKVEINYERQP